MKVSQNFTNFLGDLSLLDAKRLQKAMLYIFSSFIYLTNMIKNTKCF